MLLSKGVLKWFKLSRDPFTGELKSGKDVFSPHSCTIVELRIWKAVDEQQMAALVGDVGSGKSTIMAKVLEEMGRNKLYRIVHVYSLGRRKLTASQLCDALIADLVGLSVYNGLDQKARMIVEAFEDIEKRGQKVLLVIDEAHELPTQLLKDLKKLHEIRGKFSAPLAIVLVGQPRLRRRLQREVDLKEVLDRTEMIEVPGFQDRRDGNMEEARGYLEYKFHKAGGRKVDEVFADDGLAMLLDHPAARYPLGINNLASVAMDLATRIQERRVSADVMAMAFVEIGYDGQAVEGEEEPAEAEVV